jgi:hypothetical protein
MNGQRLQQNWLIILISVFFFGSIHPVFAQSVVKIGFVPSESFAPLFIGH